MAKAYDVPKGNLGASSVKAAVRPPSTERICIEIVTYGRYHSQLLADIEEGRLHFSLLEVSTSRAPALLASASWRLE